MFFQLNGRLQFVIVALACTSLQAQETKLYPEKADAKADIKIALDKAAHSHKRVILDFGGNWCGGCKSLIAHIRARRSRADQVKRPLQFSAQLTVPDSGLGTLTRLAVDAFSRTYATMPLKIMRTSMHNDLPCHAWMD